MRRLTNDEFRDRGPEWSPDGQRIASVSNRGGDYQLWSIRANGSSLQQVTHLLPDGTFLEQPSRRTVGVVQQPPVGDDLNRYHRRGGGKVHEVDVAGLYIIASDEYRVRTSTRWSHCQGRFR